MAPDFPSAYEQHLSNDTRFALSQGSDHFESRGKVHETLRRITSRLDSLGIPHAIVGGMALFLHGYHRFTDDVDLLVTPENLARIHQELEGLGYVPPFSGSKNLRDTESGVRIEFLTTGSFPGDGKPKPVSFPDPANATITVDNLHILSLPRLIDLKLASGMTNPARLKDQADVLELIKILRLPRTFVEQLNPYVRETFNALHAAAQSPDPLNEPG
jgi:hypothetical protein